MLYVFVKIWQSELPSNIHNICSEASTMISIAVDVDICDFLKAM